MIQLNSQKKIRKANYKDLEGILKVIQDARKYLKQQQIPQWQGDYPERQVFQDDVALQRCYVIQEAGLIIGTSTLFIGFDQDYKQIKEGKWLTNQQSEYLVIYRMAFLNEYRRKGLGSLMLNFAQNACREKGIKSIRVDTYKQNKAMQSFLKKNNFVYCGVINQEDISFNAFEKILN